MRKELFGDMSNLEILGEVLGGIAFIGLLGIMVFFGLLL
jgi:hypothetical protein